MGRTILESYILICLLPYEIYWPVTMRRTVTRDPATTVNSSVRLYAVRKNLMSFSVPIKHSLPVRSCTSTSPACLTSFRTPPNTFTMVKPSPKAARTSTTFAECATLLLRNWISTGAWNSVLHFDQRWPNMLQIPKSKNSSSCCAHSTRVHRHLTCSAMSTAMTVKESGKRNLVRV